MAPASIGVETSFFALGGQSLLAAAIVAALAARCQIDLRLADVLLALAAAKGYPLHVGTSTCWRDWVLAMQGHSEAGLAQLRQGRAAILACGHELTRPFCLVLLARPPGMPAR